MPVKGTLTPISSRRRGPISRTTSSGGAKLAKPSSAAAGSSSSGSDSAVAEPDAPPRTVTTAGRLPRRKVSLLERRLPLEVLEQILIHSENLGFPRCSPLLGQFLSGRPTLVGVVVAAFAPTWEVNFGCPKNQYHTWKAPRPGVPFSSEVGGDPEFQTAVLACSWAKIDVILEAQAHWAYHNARGRWYHHEPLFQCRLERFRWAAHHLGPDPDHGRGGFGHFDAVRCFEHDFRHAKRALLFQNEGSDWIYTDAHPSTRIPDALITGPWTDEMERRLFWLVRGGAQSHLRPQSWELVHRCYQRVVFGEDGPQVDSWFRSDLNAFILNMLRLPISIWHWPEGVRHVERETCWEMLRDVNPGCWVKDIANLIRAFSRDLPGSNGPDFYIYQEEDFELSRTRPRTKPRNPRSANALEGRGTSTLVERILGEIPEPW